MRLHWMWVFRNFTLVFRKENVEIMHQQLAGKAGQVTFRHGNAPQETLLSFAVSKAAPEVIL